MNMSPLLNRRILIIGGALVALLGLTYAVLGMKESPSSLLAENAEGKTAGVDVAQLMEKGPLDENVMGQASAPVTIIEYSSMTCPHCARFHINVLPKLKEKYIDAGKVRYIIREFPLDDLAAGASMLARCAGPMRYFAIVDTLYAKQEEWAFAQNPLAELQKFAKQFGFTEERFNQCLSDQKLLDGINWVSSRGRDKFGVRSTPSFFINGQPLKGENSVEAFEKIIDPLLKGTT